MLLQVFLNSYGKSRGSEEFLEPIGNKNPKKLFLDAQTTFKAFEHPDNLNNSSSMLTENEKSKQAKTLGEWRRKIYKFLGLNKRKEERPALATTKQSPPPLVLHDDEFSSTPLPIFMEKEDEDNLCNHYKRKDQQKFQNKIIRLAPIQPIFTSVKENPLHWNFGNFNKNNKENPGGCGDEQQQQLNLMPLEQENRLKASADKTRAANEKQQQQPSQPSQQFLLPSWSENREMCNSNRLRSLIYQLLVNTRINDPTINVERSKRFLQQKAESLFGNFYNVICGTGFFSYIAHTDEFWFVL
uniref:Ground-like domain-containing protein n=1 Tax=Meloidogyne javanica TaxID=6303 RepID=A0A915N1R4_MELJA